MHSVSESPGFSRDRGEPRACYARWRASLACEQAVLLVEFEFARYWLAGATPQPLTAIYCVAGDSLGVAVTDRELVAQGLPPAAQYAQWLGAHGLVSAEPNSPIGLAPETVAKPWGREIWYTGIERRGVCHFASGEARTPIPWLQAVLPTPVAGEPGEALVLLKVLAPSSHPVLGDLYFELHEEKREVYVVTRIDRQAWPDGVGYIRYGFDQQLVASYPSEGRFRAAYLDAVLAYEALRRELDALVERGGRPAPAQSAREALLRERMNRFTQLRPLRVGDVVQVPLLMPHALQHGVRAVEFQTPSYERKILSFAQKVLTQDHWDTREAVTRMRLDTPDISRPQPPECSPAGVRAEHIVDFPDFVVQRLTLPPGVHWQLEVTDRYRLLMVLAGALELGGCRYAADQALLLPARWRGLVSAASAPEPLVFLLATPRS